VELIREDKKEIVELAASDLSSRQGGIAKMYRCAAICRILMVLSTGTLTKKLDLTHRWIIQQRPAVPASSEGPRLPAIPCDRSASRGGYIGSFMLARVCDINSLRHVPYLCNSQCSSRIWTEDASQRTRGHTCLGTRQLLTAG
jgi:hypothetical protein